MSDVVLPSTKMVVDMGQEREEGNEEIKERPTSLLKECLCSTLTSVDQEGALGQKK